MVENFAIEIPRDALDAFCKRWKITELALFGSVVTDGFRSDSDIDILVSFAPDAEWDLFDAERMENDLGKIFQRPVDLVTRRAIESSPNPVRREAILKSAVPVYVAR